MLKIGEFSKLSRVSIRMLHHYDEIGLLMPARIDHFTGYRYYREEQLTTAGRIKALKDMGFALADISEMLHCYEDQERLEQYFCDKQTELEEMKEAVMQKIRLLETARERLRKDVNTMKYDVTLKTLPERYVASVRMTLSGYDQEGMLWQVLGKETAHMKLIPDDPCYCSVTYLDLEYKESNVDVEAQKTVKGQYQDTEHVKFKTVPPVTFASATFKGSYDLISQVNEAVAQWVRDNGYEFCGPMFNIYYVTPHDTSNPEEYITEVCYPVKCCAENENGK